MRYLLVTMLIVAMTSAASAQLTPTYEQQVHDFGQVEIDYLIFHSYVVSNNGDRPVRIDSLQLKCDCTIVRVADSVVAPGDSVTLRLRFNTADYYGPTNRSFTVFTDSPNHPQFDLFYQAVVGQWVTGMRPRPLSLFFLPSHKSKTVRFPNPRLDGAHLSIVEQYDTTYSVRLTVDEADKGEFLELSVTPNANLSKGTYHSSLTVAVDAENVKRPILFTIPIKIVRY
ncbi:MAG: DUF1573 domain-containing protein [Candidatus Zixiibacteriota bacterium]